MINRVTGRSSLKHCMTFDLKQGGSVYGLKQIRTLGTLHAMELEFEIIFRAHYA